MRRAALILSLLALAACAAPTEDLKEPVEPLGDFRLGFSEVVAPNLTKRLVSYDVTPEEWIAAVDEAVETRFSRFEGSRYYHMGISVEEYSVPQPIVPGKSALALRVTVWDDAAQAKLNQETKVITVIQVIEARMASTREERVQIMAEQAARNIETWLRTQMRTEGWFTGNATTTATTAQGTAPPPEAPETTGGTVLSDADLAAPAAAVQ
ncbi:hypothetical protein [Allosediminivita pacifica]|uniref:Lipopolysaccharide-assembly n=1 Tax=Allosediminivita pacifica TaxID=1267769 RepID=A0A2T6AS37_9RHOB|nr:hypothetical protein [Allosediminivita pacifica]PTX46635.1 hypothetical protein C8N44_1152 [Allosediminivita pacifica]GGB15706.1 hypothetical protein GCM10011324_27340 [Allosediminivita pacifica]